MSRFLTLRAAVGGLAFVAVSATAWGQIPCEYQVEAIFQGPPGPAHDSPTFPLSISPNGQYIVGYFNYDAVGQARGWYYEMPDGPFTPLPHPQGMTTSSAADVNDVGEICGYIAGTSGGFGFVFDIGTQQYTLLPPAYPGSCGASGINSDGIVCGARTIGAGNQMASFTWSPQTGFQDASLIDGMNNGFMAINDAGTVVGWRGSNQSSANTRAITGPVMAPQVLPSIPGGTTSSCRAISGAGDFCGFGRLPSPSGGFNNRAFASISGTMTLLGVLPGYLRSHANEIANNGLVGGSCDTLESNGAFAARAFLWYSGVMRDVTPMIDAPKGQVVGLKSVAGIADSGRITGYGHANGVTDLVVVLTPVNVIADLNADCFVNVSDLLMVVNAWGATDSEADANDDGIVNVSDLLLVINNWTF